MHLTTETTIEAPMDQPVGPFFDEGTFDEPTAHTQMHNIPTSRTYMDVDNDGVDHLGLPMTSEREVMSVDEEADEYATASKQNEQSLIESALKQPIEDSEVRNQTLGSTTAATRMRFSSNF